VRGRIRGPHARSGVQSRGMAFRRGRRARTLIALTLAVYGALLLVNPLLHHDLACHVKSASHCDACVANPMASRAETAVAIPAALAVVGPIRPPAMVALVAGSPAPQQGRAPPA
jgi:hypothetical protein